MDSSTAKKIKSKNTRIETILGQAMWSRGLRYRKHCKSVYGKPDFCFKGKKVAIFCDSEFWHGKNFLNGEVFKTNTEFWETKIKNNIKRDEEVDKELKNNGWHVLRFWGKDIEADTENCLKIILNTLNMTKCQINDNKE